MTQSTASRVGRFRQGRMSGTRPESLATWRVTTDDAHVADRVARLLGGQPQPNESGGNHSDEVLTERESVRILMEGPDAVTARMLLHDGRGVVHECDGSQFLAPPQVKGQPCGCPPLLQDRKAVARSGRGPMPSIDLVFRIAADPSLGEFHFQTSSWNAAEQIPHLLEELERVEGPAVCDLTLELVIFTTKTGTSVCYRKPVVTVLGGPGTVPSEAPRPTASMPAPAVPSVPRTPARRPDPSPPPAPEPPHPFDLDPRLVNRAAQALGTSGHRETIIAALSQAAETRQLTAELDRLRDHVKRIAAITGQALQAGGSSS
ncbi:hypothetical protein ACFY12_23720 [Streptomyces sp. NPDC001339]|uniref:recombination directionality factor n=1 Tax=Streptomyces sp. NPDC001339 TaxID=3364563 RepID=UPI0036BA4A22